MSGVRGGRRSLREGASKQTTLGTRTSGEFDDSERSSTQVFALVIAWSVDEPERLGEVAFVPDADEQTLGRGPGSSGEQRLSFFRQRPNGLVPTSVLTAPALSRRQLVVSAAAEGIRVVRVGRCALEVNGVRCESCVVRPGDVLHLRGELVLLVTRRPAQFPRATHFPREAFGDFGGADGTGIIGEAPATWRLREQLAFAAQSGAHVLVTGETGTGKELAARAIHSLSPRSARPFVARNAATLPLGLIDAELFGNARGYPNAGMPERPGLIGQADGGSLFLDEIGELPGELQAHLLRVLDSGGEYQRLGEATARRSHFRLIAATNRPPSALKHDFLARLSLQVALPPLAERREDLPLLARGLLLRAAKASPNATRRFMAELDGVMHPRVAPALIIDILRRDLPTNTRGLDSLLWEAMGDSPNDVIRGPAASRSTNNASAIGTPDVRANTCGEPTADQIRAALQQERGHVGRTARVLGLPSRYALYRLLSKHGIERGGGRST